MKIMIGSAQRFHIGTIMHVDVESGAGAKDVAAKDRYRDELFSAAKFRRSCRQ